MRVGFITYALDRPLTGIGRYTVELIRAISLLEDAPEIILLAAGGAGNLGHLPTEVLLGCKLLPGLLTIGNFLIQSKAKHLKLDIIHDTTGTVPLLFGAGDSRIVTTLYDTIPWAFPGVSTRLDTIIHRQWLPHILSKVDAVVTISEASKDDIACCLHVPDRKIHNIQAGVNPRYSIAGSQCTQAIKSKYQLPSQYILFVGSVESRKNLQRVLQAYAKLKHDIPHKLVIVGPKKWKYAPIMQTLKQYKLDGDVIFTGYVDEYDLPAIYSGADLFAFPSLYEGFGLPVLEAMACGTPVVTSNISSLPEIAGDAALLVDPYDVDAIAAATYQMLTDQQLHQILREKGLEQAKKFTWEKTAKATRAVYEKLMDE